MYATTLYIQTLEKVNYSFVISLCRVDPNTRMSAFFEPNELLFSMTAVIHLLHLARQRENILTAVQEQDRLFEAIDPLQRSVVYDVGSREDTDIEHDEKGRGFFGMVAVDKVVNERIVEARIHTLRDDRLEVIGTLRRA